jgi:hypothetical protein
MTTASDDILAEIFELKADIEAKQELLATKYASYAEARAEQEFEGTTFEESQAVLRKANYDRHVQRTTR